MPTLHNPNVSFTETYRCYPVVMLQGNERENINYGGKIILPPSALAKLASLNIQYPMLFELRNTSNQQHSHAGVLEFIAEEGRVYLPYWMMLTLSLSEGDLIEIKNTTLPLGTFVKIQPQSPDFLDINDPKAVLENALRNFSTLTQRDVIQINYNKKIYEIMVLEVKPIDSHSGISIVETDLEVDFAPPVGYVEKPQPKQSMASKINIEESIEDTKGFSAFQGSGQRLNGKSVKSSSSKASSSKSSTIGSKLEEKIENSEHDKNGHISNIPAPLNLPFGKLFFGYKVVPLGANKQEENEPTSFKGEGQMLRPSKK
ncbi:UFD1-domain-containing protein [Rhizophagus irregularis]|nr:ubiquitin fusion degradation protein 1 [Rhizophagus irregularis DAOM 181602=DAOM 197198]PKC13415.1 UFD1-domain-containing protein [Rhizophagus irregularis]PKC72115.1 UFD1-domain-containing protein [Rhizophagus irregularis]PKK77268.1 UFD1-domain-containing protein [Rhizophagus irregularis]PKY19658.1 UFD1-domain-containing protein [Rhizophagus irregularis]PKY45450.1 UFD1-domain-containing protein [Rhizophagus irregularis]|eukprot:XP_025166805.1 ubiquitin fusion degradation protein 1 [Rhizophagus irregularis DAOM 181602=DAOM 197198]